MKVSWIRGTGDYRELIYDKLYLIFESRLEKIYEGMGEVSVVVQPDSLHGQELSRRWREYLAGLGVSYSREHDHKKLMLTNPLYTEPNEFRYIVLEQELLDKILVIGLP